MIQFCSLLLTPLIHSKLNTILWEMASILSDVSGEFGAYCVFWSEFISELVSNINGYVLVDTGDVIWVSAVVLSLVGTVNAAMNLFVRTGRGLMSCISWIFEVFLERKVTVTYTLTCCCWSLYPKKRHG